MRSHRKLAGVVGVGALLSGTTVFWLVGYQREPLPRAAAIPPQNGCDPGQFCGKQVSMNGGCDAKDCCDDGAYYCSASFSYTPTSFPEVRGIVSGELGHCYKVADQAIQYCTRYDCSGDPFCSAHACAAIPESGEPLYTEPIVIVGSSCPPVAP